MSFSLISPPLCILLLFFLPLIFILSSSLSLYFFASASFSCRFDVPSRAILSAKSERNVSHPPTLETYLLVSTEMGRAIAQAVSRWLPTAAARVQTLV
jgi:hypothetical protein